MVPPTSYKDNLPLKAFSLLLAVLLYMFVSVEADSQVDVQFPVDYVLDEDEIMVGTYPTAVRATLSGPWASFWTYDTNDLDTIIVDLRGVEPGDGKHRIDFSDVNPPTGTTLLSIEPQEFELSIDKLITRELPVIDNVIDRPPDGFKISEVHLTPNKVEVEGPASMLQTLTFVKTRPIDASEKTESFELSVDLQGLPAPQRLKTRRVLARVEIAEEFVERAFLARVEVRPETVTGTVVPAEVRVELRGPMRFVNQLSDKDIVAFVDVAEAAKDGTRTVEKPYEIDKSFLPERTTLRGTPVPVKVRINRYNPRPSPAP